MENLLVPYDSVTEITGTNILILAPHPDDEVFGCGGAIIRHVERGAPVNVIIISDGAYGITEESRPEHITMRQQESQSAAEILGYGKPIFWDFRDREVSYSEKLVQLILEAIAETGADLVYAPSVFEMHPDHRAVAMAAVEGIRRQAAPTHLAMYEVGMPMRPNLLLNISDIADRKMQAMQRFVSQNKVQRYDLNIAALNRYRSYTLDHDVTAAEAYIVLSAEELERDPLKLYQSEYQRQSELQLLLDNRDAPLVSIIIRSLDRKTLSDALDSVALQTYPCIEVVIVNAKGEDHRDVGQWCGRFPMRMLESGEKLRPSRAANMGIDAAAGDYLIFLDDDDWFAPDHIEKLAWAQKNHPEVELVYGGVKCVDESKTPLPDNFTTAFDPIKLLTQNYIPIHAPLFSRTLLEQGCRFDETLDLYEGWDFWIQASMLTDFLFVGGRSAVYRISPDSSFGDNFTNKTAEQHRLTVFEKWFPRIKGEKLIRLAEKDLAISRLQDTINGLQLEMDKRDQKITELQHALWTSQERIAQIYNSHSWCITKPLRTIRSLLGKIATTKNEGE